VAAVTPVLLENIILGLYTALEPNNILYCFLGVSLGTLIGVIPGLGALTAMALLLPITFHLEPTASIIMLAGIWYGSTYGGNITAILLNIPGQPSSAVTVLDGYPMAKQGRAGVALFMTTIASFFGASVGIILMMLFAPIVAEFAIGFGPAEYFSLMVLGMIAASVVSTGPAINSVCMATLGVLLGLVGADLYSAEMRYIFGRLELMDGLSLVALALGLFGVAEIVASIGGDRPIRPQGRISFVSMLPTRDDLRRSWMPMIRGSSIGSFLGVLPGVGPTIAAFLAYAVEKKVSKDPDRFGKGAIEGIMGPESANNASDQMAFVPTLTLGIPGSATLALIISVLMIHGVTPGPNLIVERPEMFWGLIMSFWIGNILLVILNIPLINIWVRLLSIPYHILYPSVIVFVCIGAFTEGNSAFNLFVVVLFGVLGYSMRVLDFPAAPLLLGFVLGPMVEEHFRRAMVVSYGDFGIFFTRPLSLSFLTIALLLLALSIWSSYRHAIHRS